MLARATAAKPRAGAEPIGLIMTPNTSCGLGTVGRMSEAQSAGLPKAAQYASLLRPAGLK